MLRLIRSGRTVSQIAEALRIPSNGSGLGTAAVKAVERLVGFTNMTVRVQVREDPARPGGFCLLKNVAPVYAVNPFPGCAPAAAAFDPNPLAAGHEGFTSVTPGMALGFDLAAENKCIVQGAQEQRFGVVIDLVADGFTVVASHPVTLIVPGN